MTAAPQTSAFQDALRAALDHRGWKVADLARALGVSATAVGLWLKSEQPQVRPDNVFAAERALGVPPGSLSRLLGYLPVEAVPTITPEDAVRADPELRHSVEALVGAIEGARRQAQQRRRR